MYDEKEILYHPHPLIPFPIPQSIGSGSVMSDKKLQTSMSEHSEGMT